MKKAIAGITLLVASSATFADAPGGPNCGWGNLLLEGKSGPANHLLALDYGDRGLPEDSEDYGDSLLK